MKTSLACILIFIQLFEGKRNSHFIFLFQTLIRVWIVMLRLLVGQNHQRAQSNSFTCHQIWNMNKNESESQIIFSWDSFHRQITDYESYKTVGFTVYLQESDFRGLFDRWESSWSMYRRNIDTHHHCHRHSSIWWLVYRNNHCFPLALSWGHLHPNPMLK